MDMNRKFKYVFNLELYRPALWERFLLWFVKEEMWRGKCSDIYFKPLWNRLYIMQQVVTCNHSSQADKEKVDPMPGYDEPWRN